MSKVTKPKRVKKPDPPTSMTYDELAAHLKVSRRQVIRYVVAGQIPRPEIVRKVAIWTGDALKNAMDGAGLPLSWPYEPSESERSRVATISAKAAARKRKSPVRTTRKRSAVAGEGVQS